jgi:alkanesulfonate monooxygenase SsuD/methylene tetrahydromethanopterin reductase-like flavin-dependent oxidoreductase (luciferase family)
VNDELTIDLQVNQGQCSWAQLVEIALIAENNNYQTLWVADHLSGQVMNAPSMPECFTLLGALAAITSTINIGPLVANVGNRHPGVLASAAATVQNISGGRLILGLGAGASPTSTFAAEQRALGIALLATMGERHAKLEHTLDVLDEIWSPTRDEKFATFEMPCKLPPRIVGVNSTALAKIAGMRTDGINIRSSHPQRAEILRVAQDAATAVGRSNFIVFCGLRCDDDIVAMKGDDT